MTPVYDRSDIFCIFCAQISIIYNGRIPKYRAIYNMHLCLHI